MEPLLTAIVLWLSANFGLLAMHDLPRVERMSSIEMTNLLYQNIPADQRQAMRIDQQRPVLSLYSVERKTIYLLPEWTGQTPADLSLLVHEMVHHMQNLNPATFECPQARERPAYEAQEKWLNMFGHSLKNDFGIDRLTIFMTTACTE